MSPQEFWVLFAGKEKEHNKIHQMPDDKKDRLKKLYFDAKAKEESKKALQEYKRKKALENG